MSTYFFVDSTLGAVCSTAALDEATVGAAMAAAMAPMTGGSTGYAAGTGTSFSGFDTEVKGGYTFNDGVLGTFTSSITLTSGGASLGPFGETLELGEDFLGAGAFGADPDGLNGLLMGSGLSFLGEAELGALDQVIAGGDLSAVVALTEADDTVVAAAQLDISAIATVADVETLLAAAALDISVVVALTEADDTVVAAAQLDISAIATVADVETLLAAAALDISAVAALTEADDTVVAAAQLEIGAVVTVADVEALVADAQLEIQAVAALTEADDTVVAAAQLEISALVTVADDEALVASAELVIGAIGDDPIDLDLGDLVPDVDEDPDTVIATAELEIRAAVDLLEADDTVAARLGGDGIEAVVDLLEADDTIVAAAELEIAAAAAIADDEQLVATAELEQTTPAPQPPAAGMPGGSSRPRRGRSRAPAGGLWDSPSPIKPARQVERELVVLRPAFVPYIFARVDVVEDDDVVEATAEFFPTIKALRNRRTLAVLTMG